MTVPSISKGLIQWATDPNGNCIHLNAVWRRITGRNWDQDRGLGWAEAIHPDDIAYVMGAFQQAQKQKISFIVEYRLRCQDGAYIWICGQGGPNFSPDNEFLGYFGSAFQIAEPDRMLIKTPESEQLAKLEAMVKEHSILTAIIHRGSLERRAHRMSIDLTKLHKQEKT